MYLLHFLEVCWSWKQNPLYPIQILVTITFPKIDDIEPYIHKLLQIMADICVETSFY